MFNGLKPRDAIQVPSIKFESIQHPTSNFTHKTSLKNGFAYPRRNAALSMARATPPRSQISMARSNESGPRRSPPTIRKEFARIRHSQRKFPEKKATSSKTLLQKIKFNKPPYPNRARRIHGKSG